MKDITIKFLKEVAFPEAKAIPKNKSGGLIPRFHTSISDKYYGGTKVSLKTACDELTAEGILVKSFIKFAPSSKDQLSEPDDRGIREVLEGDHKGMKVGKDGKLSTPVYYFKDDPSIPDFAKFDKTANFRSGEAWFKSQEVNVG
jgi:hypothetical protein